MARVELALEALREGAVSLKLMVVEKEECKSEEVEGCEIFVPEQHGSAYPIDDDGEFFLVWGSSGWGFGIRTTDDSIRVFPRTPSGVTEARKAFAAKVGAEDAAASMAEAMHAFQKMQLASEKGECEETAAHGAEALHAAQHAALAAETATGTPLVRWGGEEE